MSSRSLIWERTVAKTLLRDQLVGSRLPRTIMQYFERRGLPLASVLMVAREIVERSFLLPVCRFRFLSCYEDHSILIHRPSPI